MISIQAHSLYQREYSHHSSRQTTWRSSHIALCRDHDAYGGWIRRSIYQTKAYKFYLLKTYAIDKLCMYIYGFDYVCCYLYQKELCNLDSKQIN